jgi:hypothetical protein
VSIGQTITDHDATPFGDFAYYLAVNSTTGVGGGNDHTLVTLTPGIRTHLGHDLFFLAGIEVPITGPHGFDERAIFMFVKGF